MYKCYLKENLDYRLFYNYIKYKYVRFIHYTMYLSYCAIFIVINNADNADNVSAITLLQIRFCIMNNIIDNSKYYIRIN